MGLWDKVKDAAQKAAEAAKDQVQREDSLLNRAVDKTRAAADKATVIAKDQIHRQDSELNRLFQSTSDAANTVAGRIDSIEAGRRDETIASARRYAERKKAEAYNIPGETVAEAPPPEFPNSMRWSAHELYRQIAATTYPDFRSLASDDQKWALCEIARHDRRLVDRMRSIGNAYIDVVRLREGDDAIAAALQACGLTDDPELKAAYRNWHDDAYDDSFYADDDPGRSKGKRLIGWLVFRRVGGGPGEDGGASLRRAGSDAGTGELDRLAAEVKQARAAFDAREAVVNKVFRPRRSSFESQFLVHRGVNADPEFRWTDEAADDGGDGFDGGALTEI